MSKAPTGRGGIGILLFFYLVFVIQLTQALTVEFSESEYNYYIYWGSVTTTEDKLKETVKQGYADMLAAHEEFSDWPLPAMMAGMYVDGKVWLCSSAKHSEGGRPERYPDDFPDVLKKAMDECWEGSFHRTGGVCAEPMLIATYILETGKSELKDVSISTYGAGGRSDRVGFHTSCQMDAGGFGCTQLIGSLGMKDLGKRDLADHDLTTRATIKRPKKVPKGKKCSQAIGNSCKTFSKPLGKTNNGSKPATKAKTPPQHTTNDKAAKQNKSSKASQPPKASHPSKASKPPRQSKPSKSNKRPKMLKVRGKVGPTIPMIKGRPAFSSIMDDYMESASEKQEHDETVFLMD